jgi:hypothetical protein
MIAKIHASLLLIDPSSLCGTELRIAVTLAQWHGPCQRPVRATDPGGRHFPKGIAKEKEKR